MSVFQNREEQNANRRKLLIRFAKRYLTGGSLIMFGVLFWMFFVHTVPAGHRGVVKVFGAVKETPLSEGFHIVMPWASVVDFNVRFQSATATKAEGGTSDLQEVYEDITVNYEYDPDHAPYVYNNFGNDGDIESRFIIPALYESFKAITSQYTAEQLVTLRAKVSLDIVKQLQSKLAKYRIIVSDINVQNFHFDPTFADAVRRKVVAGQNRLTAEQDLETEKIRTQKQVVDAQAEAQAQVISAEAQAKSITLQQQALLQQGGDQYIRMLTAKAWDGHLPATYSGGAIPFVNLTK